MDAFFPTCPSIQRVFHCLSCGRLSIFFEASRFVGGRLVLNLPVIGVGSFHHIHPWIPESFSNHPSSDVKLVNSSTMELAFGCPLFVFCKLFLLLECISHLATTFNLFLSFRILQHRLSNFPALSQPIRTEHVLLFPKPRPNMDKRRMCWMRCWHHCPVGVLRFATTQRQRDD